MRYVYDGPIYDPIKHRSLGNVRQAMHADSAAQALNKIAFLIKQNLGWDPTKTQLKLDPKYLFTHEIRIKQRCPECGTELMDNGDCPRCKSYEYPDYFDEA